MSAQSYELTCNHPTRNPRSPYCKDCFKEMMLEIGQKLAPERLARAEELQLPLLDGNPRQYYWALEIRDKAIEEAAELLSTDIKGLQSTLNTKKRLPAKLRRLFKVASSGWWITNKGKDLFELAVLAGSAN